MIELELNNIKKNYGLKNTLNGFSLELKTKERIALIGQNGSGKSTILKIIIGEEFADSGLVTIRKNVSIGYLKQNYDNLNVDISVDVYLKDCFKEIFSIETKLRNLELEMSCCKDNNQLNILINKYGNMQEQFQLIGGYDVQEHFNKICSKFKFSKSFLTQNYNNLSGGEKTKVNLAKLLLKKPDILLLDEPTNHLDIDSLNFLENFILNYEGSLIIVSHDRYFLDKVSTKTVLLENGKAIVYFGNYSYFIKEDERRVLLEFENYKNQQKKIERMKESINTLRKFGEIAKNEMFFKRAKSIEKRLEKMELIDKTNVKSNNIKLAFNVINRSGNNVLKIENLSKTFANKNLFKNANMSIFYGEKVVLMGSNGSGKSTLINMILNKDLDYEGNIIIGSSLKIGYIPQNIVFEDNNMTILDYYMNNCSLSETVLRSRLAQYGFRQECVFKKIGNLSGGEKVRLAFMKLMQKDINFLILDEPTNHIDIDTRELLEEALSEYCGTILFVSHDRYFINKIATRTISIENNRLKSYNGNYDNFIGNIQK